MIEISGAVVRYVIVVVVDVVDVVDVVVVFVVVVVVVLLHFPFPIFVVLGFVIVISWPTTAAKGKLTRISKAAIGTYTGGVEFFVNGCG